MLHIILIRPGSTDYDQQRRIQGNLDIPLNEQGRAEVAQLIEEFRGRSLPIDGIYAACGEPSLQTAQALADAFDLKLRKLDRLHNVNQGLWQGMLVDEVRLKQPKVYRQWQEQPEVICPPEGEMLAQAEERITAAMTKLLKRHKEGVIAIVAPEPLASLIRRFIDHRQLGDLWKALDGHGHWEILEVRPEAALSSH